MPRPYSQPPLPRSPGAAWPPRRPTAAGLALLLALTLLLLLTSPPTVPAAAQAAPAGTAPGAAAAGQADSLIYLNGQPLSLSAPPLIVNGRVLVPARAYFEALGATVAWNPGGRIDAHRAGRHVQFELNSTTATVSGRTITLDEPPRLVGQQTYVPLRLVSEGLDATVRWDGRSVHVTVAPPGRVVVVDGPLRVRFGPGLEHPIVTTVPVGTVLEAWGATAGWTRVYLPRGRMGWVATPYTRPVADVSPSHPLAPYLRGALGYLEVDGRCLGPAPVVDGQLLAPLREVVQGAGGTVSWSDGGFATVQYGGRESMVVPGRPDPAQPGAPGVLSPAPVVVGGQLLVPARSLAAQMDWPLHWDAGRQTVVLAASGGTGAGAPPCNPPASAAAYLVLDAVTGTPLAEFQADSARTMASTAKVMTALLALEQADPDQWVVISRRAAGMECTCMGLAAGQRWQMRDLIYGLLLRSGNDAAVAIAEHLAGSEAAFAGLMTQRARELGAQSTVFTDASGLSAAARTTARDLAVITRHALADPDFRAVSGAAYWRTQSGDGRLLQTRNELLQRYPGATGVKNGWTTAAGHTLVGSAYRDGVELIVVVLGAGSREDLYGQAARLLDHGFALRDRWWVARTAMTG